MSIEFARLHTPLNPLYPVVESVKLLQSLLALGINTVQLRIKDPNDPELKKAVAQAISLGREYNAQIFINDHWEMALEMGAYGIHLGQTDLVKADLPAIAHQGVRLGISTRSQSELELTRRIAPSYLAIGHIFPTQTKQMATQPQGIAKLHKAIAHLKGKIPCVAIGGIDLSNAASVWATGVDAIAVVRAISDATDLVQRIQAFRQLLKPEVRHVENQDQ